MDYKRLTDVEITLAQMSKFLQFVCSLVLLSQISNIHCSKHSGVKRRRSSGVSELLTVNSDFWVTKCVHGNFVEAPPGKVETDCSNLGLLCIQSLLDQKYANTTRSNFEPIKKALTRCRGNFHEEAREILIKRSFMWSKVVADEDTLTHFIRFAGGCQHLGHIATYSVDLINSVSQNPECLKQIPASDFLNSGNLNVSVKYMSMQQYFATGGYQLDTDEYPTVDYSSMAPIKDLTEAQIEEIASHEIVLDPLLCTWKDGNEMLWEGYNCLGFEAFPMLTRFVTKSCLDDQSTSTIKVLPKAVLKCYIMDESKWDKIEAQEIRSISGFSLRDDLTTREKTQVSATQLSRLLYNNEIWETLRAQDLVKFDLSRVKKK